MQNVIAELRSEHADMKRLLKILDRQVAIFESGRQPDYTKIQDIVLYFLDFPDQCHHPKEDLVAEKLLEVSPEAAAKLRGLAGQHDELGKLVRRVADIIGGVLNEAELPREEVIRAVKEFISSQRYHMEMEEEHFFPVAEDVLSPADLIQIESDLFERVDPLFGPKTKKHFEMLRDYVLKQEKADHTA